MNIGRRLFSVVTGVAALATGTLTGATVYLWLTERGSSPVFELPIVVVLAATTWGFGFLTWRWARSLPPSKALALSVRERDELNA